MILKPWGRSSSLGAVGVLGEDAKTVATEGRSPLFLPEEMPRLRVISETGQDAGALQVGATGTLERVLDAP